jgi:hypothetical protein
MGEPVNAARGILTGAAIGALLWVLAAGAVLQVQRSLAERDARMCAMESYGTNGNIARCYADRGLPVPGNFDATAQ